MMQTVHRVLGGMLAALLLLPGIAAAGIDIPPVPYTGGAGIAVAPPVITSTITQYTDGQASAAAPVQSVNGATGTVALNVPIYATGCTPTSPCSVATALASTCNSSTVGTIARVNNLFSATANTNLSLTCIVSGTEYYWLPAHTTFAAPAQSCTGTIALTPYATAPYIACSSATLVAALNFNIAASPTPWCGEQFNISTQALTPGLNVISVLVNGTLLKVIGAGGYSTIYVCSGTSGSWVVFP